MDSVVELKSMRPSYSRCPCLPSMGSRCSAEHKVMHQSREDWWNCTFSFSSSNLTWPAMPYGHTFVSVHSWQFFAHQLAACIHSIWWHSVERMPLRMFGICQRTSALRLSSHEKWEAQSFQQMTQNDVLCCLSVGSTGRISLTLEQQNPQTEEVRVDGWVNQMLNFNKGGCLFLVSYWQLMFVSFYNERDISLTVTKWLLLKPWWRKAPNLNEIEILRQTMIFP